MPFVSPAMPMALAADGGWRALPLARATAVGTLQGTNISHRKGKGKSWKIIDSKVLLEWDLFFFPP